LNGTVMLTGLKSKKRTLMTFRPQKRTYRF